MSKRPAVLDLNSLMVKKPEPSVPPSVEAPPLPSAAAAVEATPKTSAPKAPSAKPPAMFRTSVYFSRAVHDKLRDIAHAERKSITDLINEGLDHVLTSRNYPPTAELRAKRGRSN